MVWALKQDVKNASAKLLLISLANYADEDGICWPSITRLAGDCSASRQTVMNSTKRLIEMGLIEAKKRTGGSEYGAKSILYTLKFTESPKRRLSEEKTEPKVQSVKPKVNGLDPNQLLEPITKKENKQKKKTEVEKYSAQDMQCAEWIFAKIQQLNPKHKLPNMDNWADTIRLMRERDKKTHREIAELFAWANNDDFWKTNILSPAKLREKWDPLSVKRLHNETSSGVQKKSKSTKAADAIFNSPILGGSEEPGGLDMGEADSTLLTSMGLPVGRPSHAGDRAGGVVGQVIPFAGGQGAGVCGGLEGKTPTQNCRHRAGRFSEGGAPDLQGIAETETQQADSGEGYQNHESKFN